MGVLRVNYRRTGGVAGVNELAAGMANGITGSAGINAGGLMWLTSIRTSTYTGSIAVFSAYGLMSAYYGSGLYDSGYAIQPLIVHPLSFSTVGGGDLSGAKAVSLRTSGSLLIFQPMANGATISTSIPVLCQMLAVVISGP